ncbi:MAG: helix-turn-helix domain-containing protein [Clostridia bacterium]|nr:helix-turn-helix domain-containing protein [Clostridia bacterium]
MEKLFTPAEVAAILKVSRKTVHNWIHKGRLKAVKIGHFWRVCESELNRLLGKAETPDTGR